MRRILAPPLALVSALLLLGQELRRGQAWGDCTGQSLLVHQTDGNVVLPVGQRPVHPDLT